MKRIKIGIIGLGPRGLSVLERCIAYFQTFSCQQLKYIDLYLFDPNEPGAGCHDTTQPHYFLVNTIASQITQFSDESVRDAGPILEGPSFYDWIVLNKKIPEKDLSPNAYYSRALLGEYFNFVFKYLLQLFPKQNIFHYKIKIDDLHEHTDGTWRLKCREKNFDVDYVYLTTGHQSKKPSSADLDLAKKIGAIKNSNPLLMVIENPYPLIDKLQPITNLHSVIIEGAGLTACDIVAELTFGRGGEFILENHKLRYKSSGLEPTLFLYSRTGIPLSARALNQKSISGQYKPKFLTFKLVKKLKKQSSQLDFELQLMPLLNKELSYVYYYTLIKNQYDPATAQEFSIAYINSSNPQNIIKQWVKEDDLFSFDTLLNPVPPNLNQPEFINWLHTYLKADIVNALQGNITNPLKAACDVLRDIRDIIRLAVDFGGLTPASHEKFINQFVPLMNRLAVGPPSIRIQEWIALMEAGILHLNQGSSAKCELNEEEAKFMLTASAFKAKKIKADVLIKAKIEMPHPYETDSLLIQNMLKRKIIRPFKNGQYHPGGIEIDPQMNIVSANGLVIKNIWAIGILTEGCKFYTFVVPRPGVNSTAIVDAGRAVKQMMQMIFQDAPHYAK